MGEGLASRAAGGVRKAEEAQAEGEVEEDPILGAAEEVSQTYWRLYR